VGPLMTKTQIAAMLIFLKEAAVQIDNARLVAINAADMPTLRNLEALLREVAEEIDRLAFRHRTDR
jgi:hypothetical protein